jgi:release factor glutamine methyltransferase
LHHAVDLVVSNPPYISEGEMGSLDAEVVGWEPNTALEAGPTGLEAVREILNGAIDMWLRPQGAAVLEIAPHQGAMAVDIARSAGFHHAFVRPDLTGRDRVLVARAAP